MREKCLPIAFLKVNLRRPLLSTPRYLALCRCSGNLTFNSLILWGTVLHGLIKKKQKPKPWVFIRPLPAERPFLSPSCVLRGLGNTQLTALSLTLLVSSLPLLAMERAQSSQWMAERQTPEWSLDLSPGCVINSAAPLQHTFCGVPCWNKSRLFQVSSLREQPSFQCCVKQRSLLAI